MSDADTARAWAGDRWLTWIIGALLVLGFLVLLLWRMIFVVVPPGYVGVVFHLLLGGVDTRRVFSEGLVVKLPWDGFYLYDAREQSHTYVVQALSAEGMKVTVHATLLFRPQRERIALLHQNWGPNYIDSLVSPVAVGAIRDVLALHGSHDLYTRDALDVREEVLARLRTNLVSEMVNFDDLSLLQMDIPADVLQAIEEKLTAQQEQDAYAFRISSEQSEAERKRIEAIGIQNFYAIVAKALTPELLTWRGIEATVDLAKSSNAKIVIVGGGKDQMPLILGSDIATLPPGGGPSVDAAPATAGALPDWQQLPKLFPVPIAPTKLPITSGSAGAGSTPAGGTASPAGGTP